jgi:hypothetical protein
LLPADSTQRWVEYLEALEANVARGWSLLDPDRGPDVGSDGELTPVELVDVQAPGGVDQCPMALQERALAVLHTISELELAIVNRQHEVARQLQQRPQLPAPADRVGWGLSIRM